ncbi:lycopene cyclase family protein [Paenibacillus sp. TRM 82003]|uniref:lycopene cyclase family protein n=1 Tax=Kineococcus sp. TRM81007 TaxID=2925831 RepID=UPI001F566679|nr:lycopene cyclase family protein [Kineococcus sp. TRM81007]MCI2237591.1 lycopene cyclase family protein [Kineococcus sp. TRM81007]MCI3921837.1 lycopene cyclase family protein [Paenibacillus sp. TRM 82003]
MAGSGASGGRGVVVVGLGAAGASLAWRLAGSGVPLRVVEAPAGSGRRTQPRTWCTWGAAGPGPFGHLVSAEWPRVRLVSEGGDGVAAHLGGWRYRMLSSEDLDAAVRDRLRAVGSVVEESVVDDPAELREPGWTVVDTRPVPVPRTGRTLLLQHFLGRRVRSERPVFDASTATLMDFRVPQPAGGVAFGYVLPTSAHDALVEYTLFSASVLTRGQYEQGLRDYLRRSGIGEVEVLGEEQGVIPMTDAGFPPSPVPGVLRWGAASGSVRPSTGYAFSALQRQADVLAERARAGEPLVLPPAHRRRHLLMDSLVLEALARGRLDGPGFFTGLFARNPVHRVLGFLDGGTGPADDLRLMASSPRGPMLRTVLGRALPVRR